MNGEATKVPSCPSTMIKNIWLGEAAITVCNLNARLIKTFHEWADKIV